MNRTTVTVRCGAAECEIGSLVTQIWGDEYHGGVSVPAVELRLPEFKKRALDSFNDETTRRKTLQTYR
jgi:hypothetical protein